MRVEENGTHHPNAIEPSPAAEDKDNGALRCALTAAAVFPALMACSKGETTPSTHSWVLLQGR